MRGRLGFPLLFLALFAALHLAYQSLRGTAVERLLVDRLTVAPAAWMINLLTPSVQAVAEGHRVRAPGGSLNILAGCEGTETMLLLAAAFIAFPLPWKRKLAGALAGCAVVYALNQARILALFYSFRHDRALFDLLHGIVLPVAIIVCTLAFFLWWASAQSRSNEPGRGA
jgi:exosortase family protein XrtM